MHNNEANNPILQGLRQKRESRRVFLVGLQSIATFGVPAFGAFFLGWWLDARFHTGRTVVFALLGVAFVVSCVLFYLHMKFFMQHGNKPKRASSEIPPEQ